VVSIVSPRLGVIFVFSLLAGSVSGCGDAPPPDAAATDLPPRGTEPTWQPSDTRGLFDFVTSLAAERSRTAWVPPGSVVSGTPAEELSYDRYRTITFRDDRAIWGDDLPFELRLDHPGGGVDTPVRVHLVSSDTARRVDFTSEMFTYGGDLEADDFDLPPDAGFAGFRVLNEMNRPGHVDEIVSFRGASYFRLLGPGQVYGLSARGVALDVAGPAPEEFPEFVEFWIQRPEPADTSLVIHALLDGPSITGAFRFELVPGRADVVAGPESPPRPTALHVRTRLFARSEIERLGVAPLTSMYLHGTFDLGGSGGARADVRPRVHDSEGLLMETHAGEVIWRPLSNPGRVRVTSLLDRDPEGFGLAQSTRDFGQFLDLEAQYHRRPGLWVDPAAPWGSGAVMLAEIPSGTEFADNMVAFWAPSDTLRPGDRSDWAYTLTTFDIRPPETAGPGRVLRTRVAGAGLPGQAEPPPAHHFRVLVDFVGGWLADVTEDAEVEAVIRSSTGAVRDVRVEPLPGGGYRATWILEGEPGVPADMRAFLRADRILSETWSWLLDVPAPVDDPGAS
jgi:glucans biosynthesis protein